MKVLRSLMSLVFVVLVGCGGDSGTTPPPPPPAQTLATITLATSSFTLTAGQSANLVPQALDGSGAVIAGVTGYTFLSGDPSVVEAQSGGAVLAVGAGSTAVTVSLTRDGVTATAPASFSVTGTLPATATVVAGDASNDFTPPSIVVGLNAAVTFAFGTTVHNVTHGSTAGAPANIPNTSATNVTQNFAAAGDFAYTCTLHAGMSGTVIVR